MAQPSDQQPTQPPTQQSKQKQYDDEDLLPFFQLQKSQVLHEARAFNDTPLDARKCCSVVTELLCLLSQGETLTPEESTTLFFGVTKLFQSQDPQLRRLVYLVIKELNQDQDQAFIVISSLEKDINGSIELFRANAIRVHSKVIDASMLEQRARIFRTAIVNTNEHIASSALTAGIRLFPSNPDVIRRWVNEVREATRSPKPMVAFHGLHLLYKIHQHDKRAVDRLVSSMIQNAPESPLARCLLIRYAFSVSGNDSDKSLLNFIKGCIKHYKSPMVMFEAAKALCHVPNVSEADILLSMNVLQEFINSPRPIQRFAAVRALSGIVTKFPNLLTSSCTVDLEHLITDSNRNIATLAITTLLKTAAEYSIERLLNSITDFMAEIPDELKVVLIDAIRSVCKKFPKKYESLVGFLAIALREEGGFKYKNKIIDCLLILMQDLERARDMGLDNLCEFIEDCEYPLLSVRTLHLIGELGPQTPNPSRYIRFIFNRVLLEHACVRAAAVSCLTQFAIRCPELQHDIRILLKRSLEDEDDEVRDRATIFSTVLQHCEFDPERLATIEAKQQEGRDELHEAYLREEEEEAKDKKTTGEKETEQGDEEKETQLSQKHVNSSTTPPLEELVPCRDLLGFVQVKPIDINLKDMESALLNYLKSNNEKQVNSDETAFADAFDVDTMVSAAVPEVTADELRKETKKEDQGEATKGQKARAAAVDEQVDLYGADQSMRSEEYLQFLESVKKDLPELGEELCTSRVQSLAEPEAEYQADVIKHIYLQHIVLQVNIQTTMEGQLLTDLYLEVDYDDTDISTIPCPMLRINETGISLVIIKRGDDEDSEYLLGKFDCCLKFTVKDATADNPEFEEGFEDTYQLNELSFTHSDYISPVYGLSQIQFKQQWTELESANTFQKQGQLPFAAIQDAVDHTINRLTLSPVEESNIAKEGMPTHVANLVGRVAPQFPILVRVAFQLENKTVNYKIAVRCANKLMGKVLMESI